jgi:hypothetical protein
MRFSKHIPSPPLEPLAILSESLTCSVLHEDSDAAAHSESNRQRFAKPEQKTRQHPPADSSTWTLANVAAPQTCIQVELSDELLGDATRAAQLAGQSREDWICDALLEAIARRC